MRLFMAFVTAGVSTFAVILGTWCLPMVPIPVAEWQSAPPLFWVCAGAMMSGMLGLVAAIILAR